MVFWFLPAIVIGGFLVGYFVGQEHGYREGLDDGSSNAKSLSEDPVFMKRAIANAAEKARWNSHD